MKSSALFLSTEFFYLCLSDKTGDNEYKFIDLYAARARRIAATYARFYLETEDGGDTDKLGRYYRMALGAFASKTVSCILDTAQIKDIMEDLPWATKSLPRIQHFKPPIDGSPSHLYDGFLQVLQIENTEDSADRSKFQLQHVLKIAEHEQETILQPE